MLSPMQMRSVQGKRELWNTVRGVLSLSRRQLPLEAVSRDRSPPLSFAQQRLWFLHRLVPNNPFYNMPMAWRLSGKLDVGALETSLNGLVARHETLRTTFRMEAETAMQVIGPPGLPQSEREAEARRRVEEEAQRPFDLSTALLWRAQLLRLSAEDHVLQMTLQHIVFDEWSVPILCRDLSALYAAVRTGKHLEAGRIDQLLQKWREEDRFRFIAWSGFWMPIIERYRSQVAPRQLDLDLCRIDAEISASFKNWLRREEDREIWLWNWKQRKLLYEIPVTDRPSTPYPERANRLVIHGGGWGLGTYRSKIPEIEQERISLDVVVHDLAETSHKKPGNRYFMVDPAWEPWHKSDSDQHKFPPFAEIAGCGRPEFKNREDYHDLYDVISASKAIVIKPGGATLIDSLGSATPVIFLEPRGYAEEKNAAIWEYLGYGVSYQKWQELGYRFEVLEQLYQSLLSRRKTTIDYSRTYVEDVLQDLRNGVRRVPNVTAFGYA